MGRNKSLEFPIVLTFILALLAINGNESRAQENNILIPIDTVIKAYRDSSDLHTRRLEDAQAKIARIKTRINWEQNDLFVMRIDSLEERIRYHQYKIAAFEDSLAQYLPPERPRPPQRIPFVASIQPTTFIQGQDTTITIVGERLIDQVSLVDKYGQIEFSDFRVIDKSWMTARIIIPRSLMTGPRIIMPMWNDEPIKDPQAINIEPPAKSERKSPYPRITEISPSTIELVSGERDFVISGYGFIESSQVYLKLPGISIGDETFVDSNTIVAQVTITDTAQIGIGTVYIVNPGDRKISNAEHIKFTPPPREILRPIVSSVYPAEITSDDNEVMLLIFGDNFIPETELSYDIPYSTSGPIRFYSDDLVVLPLVISESTTVDIYQISAINPGGLRSPNPVSLEVGLQHAAQPLPVIDIDTVETTTVAEIDSRDDSMAATPVTETLSHEIRDDKQNGDSLSKTNIFWVSLAAIIGIVGIFIGRATALGKTVSWERKALDEWEIKAKTELPRPEEPCRWACKADVKRKIGDWEVTALILKPLTVDGYENREPLEIKGDRIRSVNELSKLKEAVRGDDSARERLQDAIKAIIDEIGKWSQGGISPASIKVSAKLKANFTFGFHLHHCEKGPDGPNWVKRKSWDRKVKKSETMDLCVITGPVAGETNIEKKYHEEFENALMRLIKRLRLIP